MKKELKSRLFLVVITAIICVSITAYATTQMSASNITYKNTTVATALDNIYDSLDTRKILNNFGTPIYSYAQGDFSTTNTVTLNNLSKGKYLVIKTNTSAFGTTSNADEVHEAGTIGDNNGLECSSSNCIIKSIGAYESSKRASTAVTGSIRVNDSLSYALLVVEIKEESDSISFTENDGSASNKAVRLLSLCAIPID